MRQVLQSPVPSSTPPARWHEWFEEPSAEEDIEVDVGDCCVWHGVRYAREVEAFVDEESGAVVRVVMWRYAARPRS
jgi:hypothetical protein